ncbi:MAG TPA: TonB-dependent siderophore receptor [Hyphomonas sp.]|nr:TonB-dependent siderophore receptor [Hyphomonas sp.]MCB9962209.1 TonB-dependent siderophore receptor [Hyphomonas sp.]MCB9969893.1 TonB-dependent siderophore receptor [Hyphomonas sp.]HPE46867.1 TonB-dependent siderophore receptor [Hyphomonas sp.]
MRPAIRRPRSLRMPVTMCAAIVVGAATPALADDSGEPELRNETITVTDVTADTNPYGDPDAPYRAIRSASGLFTEDLLDTPKSITVITDETLHDLGAKSFRDLFRAQPGITLGTGEGGNAFGDRIFIRGFDARNDVYVDGVRDPGVGSRETFAVQQVEILKGPSSAFGGRGTTGGAVSLVSKKPGKGDWGDVEFTLGSDATRRATLDVNHEISDTLTVRINAMTHDSEVAGRDHVFNDRWGIAAAAEWTPTDALTFGFDYYHLSTDYLPDWGHPYDVENNRPFAVRRDNFYGVLSRDFGETFADVYTANARWVISPAIEFDTILRYGQSKNAYTASAPERPDAVARTVSANAKRRDAVTDYWTNQSRFTFRFDTGAIGHTLVTGIELSREETLNRTRAFTECATLPCIGTASNPLLDLDHPDNTIPWGSDTEVTGRPTITTETAALYALDTLTFSPQWEAFVGIRADSYSADTSGLTPERNSDSDFVNWHAGLVYKPIENASIYGSFSSASNPPCEQLDAFALDYGGCDALVAAMDPVENNSLELGAKYNLGGHLDLTAAVFQITRDGVPISNGRGATTAGSQDQEVQGVEFGVAGNLTDKWSLFGGLTLFETEITDSTDATQIGEMFPNVSEQSFTLTSRYQITHRFHLGGTAGYNSEKFGGTVAAGSTFVPDYWRFDFFGGYQIADNMEVTFNILNATDELYYDALYRSGTPFSYVAPGRSALVTLDIDF